MRPLDREATRLAVVASYDDARYFEDIPTIYVEHGAGQTYVGVREAGYAGSPGLDHVVMFCCPNEQVAARWRRAYPRTDVEVVGSPALDVHFKRCPARAATDDAPPDPGRGIVAFTHHWHCQLCLETLPALDHYAAGYAGLCDDLRRSGFDPVGHAHPRWAGPERQRWGTLGVRYEADPDVVLAEASVLVADNTSLMYEAAAVGIPVVALNAPWYRREVKHGLRFWDYVPGIECDEPADLFDAIRRAADGAGSALRIRAARRAYAFRDGRSAERAADAVEYAAFRSELGRPVGA